MRKLVLIGACVCALFAPQSRAEVVIGNFDAAPGVGTAFGEGTTTEFKSFGWTMPSGDDWYLDSVTLTIDFSNGPCEGVFSIWEGLNAPENMLITLDSPNQIGTGDFMFTPAAPFVMEADMNYWLYVTADPFSPQFVWEGTDPSTFPHGLATGINYIWNGSPSSYYNRIQVNGTVVPAPASLMLLALGGLVARRRR